MDKCYLDKVPRDIKIKIVSLMDMDTRLKSGLIFKLRTPCSLVKQLNDMMAKLIVGKSLSYIKLGPYRPIFQNIADDMETMYTLTRYFNTRDDSHINSSHRVRSVNYTVCHVSQYENNDNVIRMKIHYVPAFDKY